MKGGKREKLLTGGVILGALGGLLVMSRKAAALFVREAMDRREPRLMIRAKSRMTGPEPDLLSLEAASAAKRLRNSPMERVELAARDGTLLVGHLRRGIDARRVIIAMHGWRSSWYRDFGASADFWYTNGCNVLYAEQRGQGESGGDTMCYGLRERFDCADWSRWAAERFPDMPIYLAGLSMGATTVLMAAGLEEVQQRVRGIMADCGFTSPEAIWRHVAKNTWHIPYQPWKKQIDRLTTARLDCAPDAYSTVEALSQSTLPVFFIHGLDDHFVPPEMTRENYLACPSPKKRLLLVPGAGHGMSFLVDRDAYERETLEFWKDLE